MREEAQASLWFRSCSRREIRFSSSGTPRSCSRRVWPSRPKARAIRAQSECDLFPLIFTHAPDYGGDGAAPFFRIADPSAFSAVISDRCEHGIFSGSFSPVSQKLELCLTRCVFTAL
jgi:hypothetical protein